MGAFFWVLSNVGVQKDAIATRFSVNLCAMTHSGPSFELLRK
jgi:hypothetical protein